MKALKIIGAVFGLLVAAIGVTLAVGIPGGFITSMIEERVEKETGLNLDINGGTTIKLWPLTVVTLSNVVVSDPKDRDISERFRAERIRAELSLRGFLTGDPRVREITIVRPVVQLAMARERTRQLSLTRSTASLDDVPLAIDRVVVSDATVIFRDPRRNVESRIEQINAEAVAQPGRKVDVNVDARADGQALKLEVKTTLPTGAVDGMTLPVDFRIEAPGTLPRPISGNGEVKLAGTTVTINSLSGMLGNARFSGYASIEATTKPLVKVNLDFKQLDIDSPSAVGSKRSVQPEGWSDAAIKVDGLNYVDAEFQISAGELNVGTLKLAPAKMEGTLGAGILRMTMSELGLYEGRAVAGLALDASVPAPVFALRAQMAGVRALPLLTSAGDFDKLDGKMQMQLDVRSSGRSQREMIANLSGTTNVDFQDGQIRGINIAQMIRNLTASTLNGWDEDKAQTTDLSELHASFRIDSGQAVTNDLRLAGPLIRVTGVGTTDLNTKSLSFRIEPKLVMTTQGQGSTVSDPIGLGVPVIMQGPWSAPRIHPDMQGILENPDQAFAKLRELGQGLFGPGLFGGATGQPGQPGQPGQGNKLIEGIGALIQQGLGGGQGTSGGTQGRPATTQPGAAPPAPGQTPTAPGQAPPAAAPGQAPSPQNTQSQIDGIIKQLFGR
jgi:AsmA protein